MNVFEVRLALVRRIKKWREKSPATALSVRLLQLLKFFKRKHLEVCEILILPDLISRVTIEHIIGPVMMNNVTSGYIFKVFFR